MVKRTEPYIPGEQVDDPNIIKLNTNENPYPPSPKTIEAIRQEMEKNLQLYPSPTADLLRQAIAKIYGLHVEHIFVGNGSDEVLAFAFMAFFDPDRKIRFPNITYSFYPVYAKLFHIPYEEVALQDDFTIPVVSFFSSEGGVIFPNPNAPTSLYLPLDAIEDIVQQNQDRVVIVDEAYIDFAEQSCVQLIEKYDNLLVIQTTSKSRSLAGLRVGYALGHPTLIEALIRIKDSFNSYTIDRLAMVGATAAFLDQSYFEKTTATIVATREKATQSLQQLGFKVLPSQTNFLFVTHPNLHAQLLYEQLKKEGVLVRYFQQPLIEQYVRITIGTEQQMSILIERIQGILSRTKR